MFLGVLRWTLPPERRRRGSLRQRVPPRAAPGLRRRPVAGACTRSHFRLILSLLCPFPLKLSLLCPPNNPNHPWMLKLSSNVSDVSPKVLKLSSEVSECKPLVCGGSSAAATSPSTQPPRARRMVGKMYKPYSPPRRSTHFEPSFLELTDHDSPVMWRATSARS